jgi:hypothetical protein
MSYMEHFKTLDFHYTHPLQKMDRAAKRARVEGKDASPTTIDRVVDAMIHTYTPDDRQTARLMQLLPKNILLSILQNMDLVDMSTWGTTGKTMRNNLCLALPGLNTIVVRGSEELNWLQSHMKPPLDAVRELTLLDWNINALVDKGLRPEMKALRKLTVRFVGQAFGEAALKAEMAKLLQMPIVSQLRHLDLDGGDAILRRNYMYHFLRSLQSSLPDRQLETLHVRQLGDPMNADQQHEVITPHLFGRLTSLSMRVTWTETLVKDLLQSTNDALTHLELWDGTIDKPAPTDEHLTAMVKHWPQMNHFELAGFRYTGDAGVVCSSNGLKAMSHWSALQTLDLEFLRCDTHVSTHEQLFANLRQWPRLKRMVVPTNRVPTREQLEVMNISCPALEWASTEYEPADKQIVQEKLDEKDVCRFLEHHPSIACMDALRGLLGRRIHTYYTVAVMKQITATNDGSWFEWAGQVDSAFPTADVERFMEKCPRLESIGSDGLILKSLTSSFWTCVSRLHRLRTLELLLEGEEKIALTASHLKAVGLGCPRLQYFLLKTDELKRRKLPPLDCSIADVLGLAYACPELRNLEVTAQPLQPVTRVDLGALHYFLPLSKHKSTRMKLRYIDLVAYASEETLNEKEKEAAHIESLENEKDLDRRSATVVTITDHVDW